MEDFEHGPHCNCSDHIPVARRHVALIHPRVTAGELRQAATNPFNRIDNREAELQRTLCSR